MEIHRYIRTERVDKKGKAPIRLMVHYNGTKVPFSTKEKVLYPAGWDDGKQRVKSSQPFARAINDKLDNLDRILQVIYDKFDGERKELPEDTFRACYEGITKILAAAGLKDTQDEYTKPILQDALEKYLNGLEGKKPVPAAKAKKQPAEAPPLTFLQVFDKWIEEQRTKKSLSTGRRLSDETITGLEASRNRFAEFQTYRNVPIELGKIDKLFYNEFQSYMLIHLDQGVNTFGKHIKRLKQMLTWAQELDDSIIISGKYNNFQAPEIYVGVEALWPDELKAIERLDFQKNSYHQEVLEFYQPKRKTPITEDELIFLVKDVELARDIFLACVYTSLRISDAQEFRRSFINNEIIIFDVQKTKRLGIGNVCYIPFYDDEIFKPVALIQKYSGKDDQVFPDCPNVNAHLKLVQQLAGVTRLNLTTKIGRKTFVTMKVYQGVPTRLIMQATGHKKESSFNRYLGVNIQELIAAFKDRSIKLTA